MAFGQPIFAEPVALSSTWTLFDPEGNSSLSNQSSSGFTVLVSDVTDSEVRPAVVQEFDALDLSEVGTSLRVSFDVTFVEQVLEANDSDFRFAFFDTESNFELIMGMVDIGAPSGTAMRVRIDNRISTEGDPSPGPYIPGDFAKFADGGGTLAQGGMNGSSDGLQYPEDSNQFEATVTRISATELELTTTWISVGPTSTSVTTQNVIFDESLQANIDNLDVPTSGSFSQMNGFGFKINDNDPFDSDDDDLTVDSGSYTISNLKISKSSIVTLGSTWTLFDPEGNSSLSGQSSSGFTAEISDVTDGDARPAVVQEFSAASISEVGESVEVSFDVNLLDDVVSPQDTDFRFVLYDTESNFQFLLGMIDAGAPSGTAMRMRIDDRISAEGNPAPGPFIPGDYSHLCGGGGTLNPSGSNPGNDGLQFTVDTSHFKASITRISATELELSTTWITSGVTPTVVVTTGAILNEASPANADDVPTSGSFTQLNGFGIRLYDNDFFDVDGDAGTVDPGSYEVSNLEIRHCVAASVEEEIEIEIVSVVRDGATGDVTITWVSEDAQSYDVVASGDLMTFGPTPEATVTATGATASFVIPNATVLANSKRFYRIEESE